MTFLDAWEAQKPNMSIFNYFIDPSFVLSATKESPEAFQDFLEFIPEPYFNELTFLDDHWRLTPEEGHL